MNSGKQITLTAAAVAVLAALPIGIQSHRIGELKQRLAEEEATTASSRPDGPVRSDQEAARPAESESDDVGSALEIRIGPLREATLVEMGYRMAARNLQGAMAALDGIEGETDRREFLRGVFSYAANHKEPEEVLELSKTLEDGDRKVALLAVIGEWTEGRSIDNGQAQELIKRFGVETGLGVALAWDEGYRVEIGEAWAAAFPETPGRALMFGSFAAKIIEDDREAAFAMGAHLTGYEREMFLLSVVDAWSPRNPEAVWEWAQENLDVIGSRSPGVVREVIHKFAQRDFARAEAALAELTEPELRRAAVREMAGVIAWRDGTVAAVEWANTLSDESEKDVAHAIIGIRSPQGIGAALAYRDGFVEVTSLIEGGAALRDGQLQVGDRVVEVDPGTGDFELVYGQPDINKAVEFIRGESGSTVRLRVVRPNAEGHLEDQIITIRREQIVMPAAPEPETSES